MENNPIRQIIQDYIGNGYNESVQYKFQRWLIASENADEKKRFLMEYWNSIETSLDEDIFSELSLFHELVAKQEKQKTKKQSLSLWIRIATVLVVVLISSFATYYFTSQSMLEVEMIECFAENGDIKKVVLPDKSEVWLNSGSLIIYPDYFEGSTRSVFLNGEAIFSVTPDNKKPFIVKTSKIDVEALGTVFNVKAYTDLKRTIATLHEGSVQVRSKGSEKEVITLIPNEQVIYDTKTNILTKVQVDSEKTISWRNGYMVFEGATLEEILHGISKKFNVMIQYNSQLHADRSYTIRFSPEDSLIQILDILQELSEPLRYEIQGKTVHVY